MPEAGMEKTMDEILEQVQREYAEQAKEVMAQPYVDARDVAHDNSKRSPEGLPNREKLTRNEIEQARQHVAREREALLSRQCGGAQGTGRRTGRGRQTRTTNHGFLSEAWRVRAVWAMKTTAFTVARCAAAIR
jgi:hypothetical protein